MAGFALPHDHGEGGHIENLHRELMNVAHFTAVSEIFKQLSDPTRVRIFWLLSHREECVINLAALLEMSSPAVSHHLRSLTVCSSAGETARRSIIKPPTQRRSGCCTRSWSR